MAHEAFHTDNLAHHVVTSIYARKSLDTPLLKEGPWCTLTRFEFTHTREGTHHELHNGY